MVRHRVAVSLALLIVCPFVLSGCAIDYFAKTGDGQKRLDRAIADSGLAADGVTGDYSCTGALPLTATSCYSTLRVTTDDAAVLERVAGISLLADEQGSWQVRYRGVDFTGSVRDEEGSWAGIARVPAVADALPAGAPISEVTVQDGDGADVVTVRVDGVSEFGTLCAYATDAAAGGITGSVVSRVDRRTDLAVGTDAARDPGFAAACALAGTGVEAIGVGASFTSEIRAGASDERGTGDVVVVLYSTQQDVATRITAWRESVTPPEGVELRAR